MEQCTSSKRIYEGRVINLRVDEVLLNGRAAIREVVEHRGAAVIVPVIEENLIVFVRQYRYPIGADLLEIPAGTCDDSESPEDCARRELEEEAGFKCEKLEKILECYVAPGYSTEKLHFYLARKLARTRQNPDPDESLSVEVIPLPSALEKIREGEICDAKTICALHRTLDFIH
jgi:ADP-ribose pyrophosphatase